MIKPHRSYRRPRRLFSSNQLSVRSTGQRYRPKPEPCGRPRLWMNRLALQVRQSPTVPFGIIACVGIDGADARHGRQGGQRRGGRRPINSYIVNAPSLVRRPMLGQ